MVASDAETFFVADPEVVLGNRKALLGCLAKRRGFSDAVASDIAPFKIHRPERRLGIRIPLLGGLVIPVRSLNIVV